jgi:hypothetical protein
MVRITNSTSTQETTAMTTETARRAILESIGNTRDVIEQARMEGAALRGELGVAAQILAMSELYKRLKAQGRDEEAQAVKTEAYAIHAAAQVEIAAESDMTIPPTEDILNLVKERHDLARLHEDIPGARQLDRVRINLLNGAKLTWSLGDLLIQSVNRPGAVYSVNRTGCTCPNGLKGKAQCWHVALYDLLLDMLDDRAAAADILADAAAERAEADLGRRLAAARACYQVAA